MKPKTLGSWLENISSGVNSPVNYKPVTKFASKEGEASIDEIKKKAEAIKPGEAEEPVLPTPGIRELNELLKRIPEFSEISKQKNIQDYLDKRDTVQAEYDKSLHDAENSLYGNKISQAEYNKLEKTAADKMKSGMKDIETPEALRFKKLVKDVNNIKTTGYDNTSKLNDFEKIKSLVKNYLSESEPQKKASLKSYLTS